LKPEDWLKQEILIKSEFDLKKFQDFDPTGLMTRQAVRSGQPIPHSVVHAPFMIRKGEKAVISSKNGGIVISDNVEAVDAGSAGDVIRVKNLKAGR